jgi:hypothetical protein
MPKKAEIALATVSGKAYYLLVRELKRRRVPFLSLQPGASIPLTVKAVITTGKERALVIHPQILVFDEADAAEVVNEAIRAVQGKQNYEHLIIGVDPGRTIGVAVMGDGKLLEALNGSSLKEATNVILNILNRVPAATKTVKIGDGAPTQTEELLKLLDEVLPADAVIEVVCEAGTSQLAREESHRRDVRDAMAALKIAERKGRFYTRRRSQ